MIDNEDLDVRTITMGISLLDCIDPDVEKAAGKVYDKICRYAEHLVKDRGGHLQAVWHPHHQQAHFRHPHWHGGRGLPHRLPHPLRQGIGPGRPHSRGKLHRRVFGLVHKGFGPGDYALIESIPQALDETELVCSSVNVGTTKAGINMDAVEKMGRVILETAQRTADRECIGAAKLVVFCNAPEDNPFMAGAFHGPGEPDCVINVGVSGPGGGAGGHQKGRGGQDPHRDRRAHQAHGLQDHENGTAGGPGGQPPAVRALRHRGSVAGPHPGHRGLGGLHSGGHGLGAVRRPRHHGGAGPLKRRGEEGRRHGVLQRGAGLSGAFIPVTTEGRGHDRGRPVRVPDPHQAGGHDRGCAAWAWT